MLSAYEETEERTIEYFCRQSEYLHFQNQTDEAGVLQALFFRRASIHATTMALPTP